jgi:twinfilin-like protein
VLTNSNWKPSLQSQETAFIDFFSVSDFNKNFLSSIMARANLSIHADIAREFTNAQESKSTRIIKIRIVDEELRFDSLVPKHDDCNNDFTNTLFGFNEREACIALFCATDQIVDVQSWILVAWVPEGCRVRDKMLYASSREDIKTHLGASFFSSEYYANTFADLTWENYRQSLQRDFGEEILTEKERLIKEEKVIPCKRINNIVVVNWIKIRP